MTDELSQHCEKDQVVNQPVEIAKTEPPRVPFVPTLAPAGFTNKLCRTWVNEGESYVVTATVCGDELKLCMSQAEDGVTVCLTFIADYTLTKDGLVHGVITGIDAEMKGELPSGDHGLTNCGVTITQLKLSLQSLIDCPFSFRTRMTSAGLMVTNPKLGSTGDGDLREAVQLLGGMYKPSIDGTVPAPKSRKSAVRANESCRPIHTMTVDGPGTLTLPPPSSPPPIPILPPEDEFESKNEFRVPITPDLRILIPPLSPPTPDTAEKPGLDKKQIYSWSLGLFSGPSVTAEIHLGPTPPANPAPPSIPILPPEDGWESKVPNESDSILQDVLVKVQETRTGQFMVVTPPPLPCPSQINPSQPSNVPADSFDILSSAFGQMLTAADAHAVRGAQLPVLPPYPVQVVVPPCPVQVILPCPIQAIPPCPVLGVPPGRAQGPVTGSCEIQITGVALAPCTSAVPAVRSHVGTWVRVVGPVVYSIQLTGDHMTITATSAIEHADGKVVTERAVMTADYHLMRDGTTAVGLITSFDAQLDGDLPEGVNYKAFMGDLSQLQKALTDKPLALSLRMYGDALVIGNVRLPEMASGEAWSLVTVLGGRYTLAGDKPLPKPKIARIPMMPQCYPPPAAVLTPVDPLGNLVAPPGPMYPPPGGMNPMSAPSPYVPGGAEGSIQLPPSCTTPNCSTPTGTYPNVIYSLPGGSVISGCGGTMVPPAPYQLPYAPATVSPYAPAPVSPQPNPYGPGTVSPYAPAPVSPQPLPQLPRVGTPAPVVPVDVPAPR